MVQSNKYYKSRAVGVKFEEGLTTDRDISVLTVLKKHDAFNSSETPEVTWYEPLYSHTKTLTTNKIILKMKVH